MSDKQVGFLPVAIAVSALAFFNQGLAAIIIGMIGFSLIAEMEDKNV